MFEFLGGAVAAWLAPVGVRSWWRTAHGAGAGWAVVGMVVVAARPEADGLALTDAPLRVLVFGPPAVLILYGAVFVVGYVFYRWVEKPLLTLGRNRRKPEPAAPATPVAPLARAA